MKRMLSVALSVLLVLSVFTACQREEPTKTAIANPVKSCTLEEIQELGYHFTLPDDASDISYSIITISDSEKVAQVSFTADGVKYNHRVTSANEMSDISGVYFSIEEKDVEVEYCPAKIAVDEDGLGKVYWYDVVPGLLYSISVDGGATEELLLTMAEEVFVSAQSDVG